MENESTFVAPEGVYTITEEHKPNLVQAHPVSSGAAIFPTKVSAVVVRFPPTKQGGPGFAQLLGGNKDVKKEKGTKDREDGASLSSSDTLDEVDPQASSTQEHATGTNSSVTYEQHTLFSHSPLTGKKKTLARPKHNMRTTSSTFITRIQTAEGLTRTLQSKQGDVTFLFYNVAKSFVWIDPSSRAKVRWIRRYTDSCGQAYPP